MTSTNVSFTHGTRHSDLVPHVGMTDGELLSLEVQNEVWKAKDQLAELILECHEKQLEKIYKIKHDIFGGLRKLAKTVMICGFIGVCITAYLVK